ncbi:thermonuclease family protein [Sulfitobacter undariae]|nr:thermonuclease family protein [Sulfitobacter undariae]
MLLMVGWVATDQKANRVVPSMSTVPSTIRAQDIRVVDGDTIALGAHNIRLMGFDTPETYRAKCTFERNRGDAATKRLRNLVNGANTLDVRLTGRRDKFGRGLGGLYVDGRDVGALLIEEGLARPYHGGTRQGWCDGT